MQKTVQPYMVGVGKSANPEVNIKDKVEKIKIKNGQLYITHDLELIWKKAFKHLQLGKSI